MMSRVARRRARYSIRFKVVVPLLLAGVIFTLYTYLLVGQYMNDWLEDEMAERAARLHATLESASRQSGSPPDLQAVTLAQAADDDVELIVVVDRSGQVVASTNSWNNLALSSIPDPDVRAEIEQSLNGTPGADDGGEDIAYLYVEPIRTAGLSAADTGQLAVIQLNSDGVRRDARLATWATTGAVALISLFAVGLVHSQVTRHVLMPIETLEDALRRPGAAINTDTIKQRRDEIGSLARAVGDTLERLSSTSRPPSLKAFDSSVTFRRDGRILDATVTDDQDILSPKARMIDTNLDRHLPPEVCDLLLEEFDAMHLTGDMLQFEFEHYAYGLRTIYEARARANPGSESAIVVIRDVSDQKELAEQIETIREQTRQLLAALPVTIAGLDLQGNIVFTNHVPFGANAAGSAEGEPLVVFAPENQRRVVEDAIESAIASGTSRQFQLRTGTADEPRYWLNEIIPLSTQDGAGELLLVSVDLTRQRGVEERLHAQVERLQVEIAALTERQDESDAAVAQLREEMAEAARVRDEALRQSRTTEARLSTTGEQLSGQLSALSATVAALQRVARDQQTQSFAEALDANLSQVVDTLAAVVPIDVSQETRRENNRRTFFLTSIVDDAIDAVRLPAEQRQVRLQSAIQPGIPLDLIGDPAPAQTALQHLVENAVRVAPQGGQVEIVVSQDPGDPGDLMARFEVFDNGPGLNDAQRADLNAFFNGENVDSKVAGAGLIATLEHVRDLDGEMGVESVPDGGTLFWFTARFDVDEEALAAHQWIRGLRTLVVQSRGETDGGIRNALSSLGIIGYAAGDVESVQQAFKSAEDYQNPYRLVLVDLSTPNLPAIIPTVLTSGVPVILVGSEQQQQRISEASARIAGFLVRPIRQTDLLELILEHVDRNQPQRGSIPPPQPADF